jgi:hypothetical protein
MREMSRERDTVMNAIRIHKQIDSETLHLPELRPLIGKRVEIIVLEEPAPSVSEKERWQPLIDAAGKDLIDPEAYKRYGEYDRQHNTPPG